MNNYHTTLISIDTDLDIREARDVELVFMQKGRTALVKSGEDVFVNENTVQTVLSKEETGLFEPGRYIPIQINAYYDEGTFASSNVMYRPLNETMKGAR